MPFTSRQIRSIRTALFAWYRRAGRHTLPWRQTTDLYRVTVAEIMLQQTNVPKVMVLYHAFLKKFPSWHALAEASQAQVVRAWQGLGYNRRAVYLHQMARIVVTQYGGHLPEDPVILRTLPGIGPYTGHAILIFGRNRSLSAVDVNISRCVRRLFGSAQWLHRAQEEEICAQIASPRKSRDWHNAMMDLASHVCTKKAPQCAICPLARWCASYPHPHDFVQIKRKEHGRMERGRHVPRRIYRGRIVNVLRNGAQTAEMIGATIKNDWQNANDQAWLDAVLLQLHREGMITCQNGFWDLAE